MTKLVTRELEYRFRPVSSCDMCGASPDRFATMGMRLNRSQGMNPRALAGIAVGVRKCRECGLVFADPQPLPKRFEDHYGDDYWEDAYFEREEGYFQKEIADAKTVLPPLAPTSMHALDIGAGVGKAMEALAEAGFQTYGIEPSAAFRDIAIRRGIPAAKLAPAGIENAAFEPSSFDFITFGAVLEHLPSPSNAIERALQWLKPNGIIQLEVPSSRHLVSRLVNLYFRMIGTTYVTNVSPMHPPYHLFEFTPTCFSEHGRRAGYSIALQRYSVCEVHHFPGIVHPLLQWYMGRTGTGMQLTMYLVKRA